MATIKQSQAIAAVEGTKGNHTDIAKALGCSRAHISKLRDKWPKFDKAVQDAKEARIDWVESRLDDKINDGDTTAIIFFLKTQGKSRGYVERTETDVTSNGESLGDSLTKAIDKVYGSS